MNRLGHSVSGGSFNDANALLAVDKHLRIRPCSGQSNKDGGLRSFQPVNSVLRVFNTALLFAFVQIAIAEAPLFFAKAANSFAVRVGLLESALENT